MLDVKCEGYDPKTKELKLRLNGNLYLYNNVPDNVACLFYLTHNYIGQKFNKHIKDKFECTKIEE